MSGPAGMTGLALRSLRFRRTSFTATFVSVVLATALVGSFATLVETAAHVPAGSSGSDRETLLTMGFVVGAWGAVIALFSLASTLGIAVRQRDVEIGLLRTVGCTPRQARRMVRVETLVVAVVGALLGAALAWLGGRFLLWLLTSSEVVAPVEYGGGPASLSATAGGILVVSLLAATVAGRRATRGPARLAIADGQSGLGRMRWWRVALGIVLVGYGATLGVLTATVMASSDDPYAPMMTAGNASIVTGVGLALLAPLLLRWASLATRPLLGGRASTGVAAHLAGFNTSRRAHLLAGALGPVIVFTAVTLGVLTMVGIDGRTLSALVPDQQEADTITLLNYVVTGMIALFAAIMVVNAMVAVTGQRRAEFTRLQLVGATRAQVQASVLAEAWIVAGTGVVLGSLASLATVVPYAVARDEGVVPDGGLWLMGVLVVLAGAITLAGARTAARRTIATTGPDPRLVPGT